MELMSTYNISLSNNFYVGFCVHVCMHIHACEYRSIRQISGDFLNHLSSLFFNICYFIVCML